MSGRGTQQREKEPLPTPRTPGSPAHPRDLVVVSDPWNWAAAAVFQELLLEAETDVRHELSGCSPGLRNRGRHVRLPQLPS